MILKIGSKGEEVKKLQRALGLTSDGIFGKMTERAVMDYQLKNNLVPDGIVGSKTLEKIYGTKIIVTNTNKRKITKIILHCTAGWANQSTESIKAYWRSIGWKNVGYHYLINEDGTYEILADESVVTNGVAGHNANSIHICYKGGIEKKDNKLVAKDTRTEAQKITQEKLVREVKAKYPNATIHGHNEFSNKACPSFDVKKWLKEIGI